MTDLSKDLAACVEALGKATPGTVMLATSCSWRRILTATGECWLVPTVDRDGHPNMDKTENADAAVAAVNFLRHHHAAMTEAIAERDALRNERDNLKSLLRETLPYLPTELRGRVKGVVGK